jgi:hypothetical protein
MLGVLKGLNHISKFYEPEPRRLEIKYLLREDLLLLVPSPTPLEDRLMYLPTLQPSYECSYFAATLLRFVMMCKF